MKFLFKYLLSRPTGRFLIWFAGMVLIAIPVLSIAIPPSAGDGFGEGFIIIILLTIAGVWSLCWGVVGLTLFGMRVAERQVKRNRAKITEKGSLEK
jgi:hypothetical protein